jgi:hypothetical protein
MLSLRLVYSRGAPLPFERYICGALPPVIVVVITASGEPEQSNVFVTTAAAVNRGYTTVGCCRYTTILSLIETVYVPAGTLNVGLGKFLLDRLFRRSTVLNSPRLVLQLW